MKHLLLIFTLLAVLAMPVTSWQSKKGVGHTGGTVAAIESLNVSLTHGRSISGGRSGNIPFSPMIKPPLGTIPESYLDELRTKATKGHEWWIYLNEPELTGEGPNWMTPENAMIAWPQVRNAILEVDPTAKFVFGNVLWTAWGYTYAEDWLNEVLAIYPSLPDEIDAWGSTSTRI